MTEVIGDFTWTYSVVNGFAVVETMSSNGDFGEADIVVPSKLGEFQVKALSSLDFFQDPSCKTLTLPETIEFIGEIGWGMHQPPLIQNISVSNGNPWFSSNDGILYDKTGKKLIYCPSARSGVFSIPDGVEMIADMALDVNDISVLKIPASVRLIGDSGMGDCFFRPWKLKTIEVDPGNKYYSSYGGALYDKNHTAFLYAPFDLEGKWKAEENGEQYEQSDFVIKDGTQYYAGPGIWLCDFDTVFIPDSVIHFGRVIEGGTKTVSIPGRFQSSNVDSFIQSSTSIFRPVLSNDQGTKPPNDDIANAQVLFGDAPCRFGRTSILGCY